MTIFGKSNACQPAATTSPVMQECDSRIQAEREIFDDFINTLFKSGESKSEDNNAYLVLAFIQRTLTQFKLNHYYDEVDVILKSRDIVLKKITSGLQVTNKQAWFKRICYNVIRDLSKKTKREEKNINKLKDRSIFTDSKEYLIPELTTTKNVEALFKAFSELSELERQILILREVKELSWKVIGEILVDSNYEVDDKNLVSRVRKKGERALKKLRDIFFTSIK
jgi:DNA-directed RNA polymerase specialized sigma24 family protein